MKFKAIAFSDSDHNGRCTGDSMYIPETAIDCERNPTFSQLTEQFINILKLDGFDDDDLYGEDGYITNLSGFWIVSNAKYDQAINIGQNANPGNDSAVYVVINMIKSQLQKSAVNIVMK